MEHRDEGDPPGFSSVRVWLCGSLTIEWLDPATGCSLSIQDMSSGGREYATAFSLLKLLLCQPQRRAHRDWIMEQFWPESGRSTATHRLENIFSVARKIARHPLTDESFLRSFRAGKENGMIYQLAAYPLLWVDVDALIWNVEQAHGWSGLVMMRNRSGSGLMLWRSVVLFWRMTYISTGCFNAVTKLKAIIGSPFTRLFAATLSYTEKRVRKKLF